MMKFLRGMAASMLLAFATTVHADEAKTDVKLLYTAASPFVAVYVAKEQGFFDKNGVRVELQLAQNGSVLLAGILSNSAQVGLPTPTVILQAINNGMDLRVFAATNIFPDSTAASLIVGTDSGIRKAADLSGKKVGVPGIGGLLDVVMRKWVDENGGNSGKMNIVEVILPQTGDALKSKQVDAVTSVDPFASRAVESGAGTILGSYMSVIEPGSPAALLTTTGEWASSHPEAIAGMQRALEEAAAFIATHPGEARAAIAKYTSLPLPVLANIPMPNLTNLRLDPNKSLGFWQKIALEQGLITEPVDLTKVVIPFRP